MDDRLLIAIDKFSHDLSIAELQQLYQNRGASDLSYHDTLYLNIILAHPNRYTSSQVADLLKITRPAVTQKINELTKKGYVIRTQSEQDRRVFFLSINPNKPFYTEMDRAIERKVALKLRRRYGDEAVERMCDMLEFLSETIYNEKLKGQYDEE